MGEEQKEEEKKEEVAEEKKEEEKKEEEPPEIVLKVDMHCEGCARKVEKSLRKFEGVEDVKTDCKSKTVVIKGKGAEPAKICERIQKKTGKKVELISPLPPPPEEEKKEEEPLQEEKKEEPKPVTVTLKLGMHCDACAQLLQKRIKKIGGVESAVADVANGLVVVKGFVDKEQLVQNVYRRTRKQASIVPEEEKKEEEAKAAEPEKKEENDEGGGEEKKEEEAKSEEEKLLSELSKYEYWPARYYHVAYAYPVPEPEVFSDENPNACSVM